VKFFTPKFMKIGCYLRIFTTFGSDFKTRLNMYGFILTYTLTQKTESIIVFVNFGEPFNGYFRKKNYKKSVEMEEERKYIHSILSNFRSTL
jgi:hypothetical protein